MASAISCAAPSPCTLTGQTHTSAAGQRRDRISSMSRTAEPVGLVTSTTRRGMRGSFFLRAGSKKPWVNSFSLSWRKASSSGPIPLG